METVQVILNPYAGRGRGAKMAREIEAAFRRHNVPCEIAETSAPGEAVSLARRARLDGYAIVAAAGGDGTVHEVVNGLAEATPEDGTVQGLAVLQTGSGNDFSDMVGAAREIDAAVHAIRAGNTRHVDLGLVEAFDGRNTLRRYFDNNLGIGFEAQVTVESRKIKRLRGFLIYLWATLRALRAYDQPHFEISWTDGAGNERSAAKQMLLVSIGNSRRVGGGLLSDAGCRDGRRSARPGLCRRAVAAGDSYPSSQSDDKDRTAWSEGGLFRSIAFRHDRGPAARSGAYRRRDPVREKSQD